MIVKLITAVILIMAVLLSTGDSVWYFDPPSFGRNSASFKMSGTVPPKTPENFGGFYRGFPGDSEKLTTQDDW